MIPSDAGVSVVPPIGHHARTGTEEQLVTFPANNTISLVRGVVSSLKNHDIEALLGGGWAEELHGTKPARAHKDIDLYVIASGLGGVDEYIVATRAVEIVEKHLAHKRGFLVKRVLVEAVLIKGDGGGFWSDFWDTYRFAWPKALRSQVDGIDCLFAGSPAHLQRRSRQSGTPPAALDPLTHAGGFPRR